MPSHISAFVSMAKLFAVLLLLTPLCAAARTFDIGLDGKTPYPQSSRDQILDIQSASEGRSLHANELDAFKAILTRQGWPTYRTSGPALIDASGKLLERAGLDVEFQKYMLRVLDQQVGDDVRPAVYARLADRIHASHSATQLYGTLHQQSGAVRAVDPPIASLGAMLFFRDFYGLPSLEEELASESVDYTTSLSQPPATYSRPDIRTLLGELIQPDQSLRAALSDARKKGDTAAVDKLKEQIAASDQEGLRKIKQVFDDVGFPTREMVGIDGVSTAFLLVQHADEDPDFQKRALQLATPLLETRGMSRRQYAMLADRVALASGGPQLYGTQMTLKNGTYVLQPTTDMDGLDKRRLSMALGPYQQMLDRANSKGP